MEQYASELVLSFGPRGSLAAACRRLPTLSYTGSRGHRNAVAVIQWTLYYKYWVLTIHHYPPISMHTAYILETQIYISMTGLPQRSQSSRPLMVHYIWRHYHWPWLVGCPEGGQAEEDLLIHHCPRPCHVILPRVWRKLCRERERRGRERERRGREREEHYNKSSCFSSGLTIMTSCCKLCGLHQRLAHATHGTHYNTEL